MKAYALHTTTALQPLPSVVNMPQRRVIAEGIFGGITWTAGGVVGFCACPGAASHSTPTAKRDCRVAIGAPHGNGGAPHASCFHAGCGGQSGPAVGELGAALRQLRSAIGKAETAREQPAKRAAPAAHTPSPAYVAGGFPAIPSKTSIVWRGGKESF